MKTPTAVSVTLILAFLAFFVWQWPVLVHFYDLTFPKKGLYEPVLQAPFDFWSSDSARAWPVRCTFGWRTYELAISVPEAVAATELGRGSSWPDIGGSFRLVVKVNEEIVVERKFTGRANTVHFSRSFAEPRRILSLEQFPMRRCGDVTLELEVLEPATRLLAIRPSAELVVHVSPGI